MLSERHERQVLVHTGDFLPYGAVVSNKTLTRWAEKTGADGLEWMPLGFVAVTHFFPFGPTYEVVHKSTGELRAIFGQKLVSGHVTFHWATTFKGIVSRRKDPLRGRPYSLYHLAVAQQTSAEAALHKLQAVKNWNFPVVVYPPVAGQEKFGTYHKPLIQTCPSLFNDARTARDLVRAVQAGQYAGVCLDTAHMWGGTERGVQPFGRNEDEIFESIDTLVKGGVLREVHFQPGRIIDWRTTETSLAELGVLLSPNPNYHIFLGRLIHHLDDTGFKGLYTVELDPRAPALLRGKHPAAITPGQMIEDVGAIVDYIKRA